MTTIVMMLGIFGVPIVLLWAGHRLRRRSARWRQVFIAALVAYAVAIVLSLVASMKPASVWQNTDTLRGVLGAWILILAPLVAAVLRLVTSRR